MKCAVCGTENPDNAKFCGICGRPFADPTAPSAELDPIIPDIVTVDSNTEGTSNENNAAADEPIESYTEADPIPDIPPQDENQDAEPYAELSADPSDNQSAAPAVPTPIPDTSNRSAFSGSGYGSAFTPADSIPSPAKSNAGKHAKEKKVVSLSVAVFCIIAVFILAVICGVLAQLYTRKSKSEHDPGRAYSSSRQSDEAGFGMEYELYTFDN